MSSPNISDERRRHHMNPFYPYTTTHQHIYNGPLAPIIDAYAALLNQQGYKRQSDRIQIRLIADFSRWIERQGFTACRVSQPIIDRYLHSRYQRYRPRRDDRSTLNRLVALLREKGIVPDPIPTTIHTPPSANRRGLQTLPGTGTGALAGSPNELSPVHPKVSSRAFWSTAFQVYPSMRKRCHQICPTPCT